MGVGSTVGLDMIAHGYQEASHHRKTPRRDETRRWRTGPDRLCSPAMRRLAALALVLAAAAPAAAQEAQHDVVVLSVGGDAPEDAAREVRQAVAAALEADGLRVLPEAELALRVPPGRLHGCD